MNRRSALLLLTLGLPLSACAAGSVTTRGIDARLDTPYTLAAGDKLRVIVFGQDNLSNIYTVDGAGRIAMPLIGTVAVAKQTTTQVERMIEGKLRAGYIREPRVTVEIDTYRPFFILGEVTTSGQFPFVSGMTVQTAVAIAGGFSPRALRSEAEITRKSGDAIVTGLVPITYPVRPGDTIVIKERWF